MAAEIDALSAGTSIAEYRIESLLGAGGFGLTYLATDKNLKLKVALKEYLPSSIASRGEDSSIRPRGEEAKQTFEWGKERFLDESRTLASFRHPAIVRVMRFFEANSTAYMVMEFVEGQALDAWAKARRPLGEAAVRSVILPLLEGLKVIHASGYLHRDIKPGNIYMRSDGMPVLLDFGSARQTMENTELTAIVSPGWAPFEQYHSAGKQGPWSDLYAVGGVLYWMITGQKPIEAASRIRQDTLPPATKAAPAGMYSAELLTAIDWALHPHEDQRPQSVAELLQRLGSHDPTQHDKTVPAAQLAAAEATMVRPAAPAGAPTSMPTSMAPGTQLDREQLKQVEGALALHLGPIAPVMVRKAAKTAMSLAQLAAALAPEIADEKARAAFLKKFSENSQPSQPSQLGKANTQLTGLTQVALSRFDQTILSMAEKRLSEYIGAVAKVVVKRAAAKARDEGELYLLIADEISDPAERKAFIRKAISVSGKS
jgi:serine/threonine protein kinase